MRKIFNNLNGTKTVEIKREELIENIWLSTDQEEHFIKKLFGKVGRANRLFWCTIEETDKGKFIYQFQEMN